MYFEIIMPAVKKILSAVKEKGIPVIFFPKGIGTGLAGIDSDIADCISIDWQTPLPDARKAVGNNIVLQGNLDPRILSTNKKVIDAKLKKYLSFGKTDTKWIFNLGHGLMPDNPFENVKHVVDWIKNTDWERDNQQ